VWDHDVAVQLATEFINEDLAAGLEVSAIEPRSTEIAALYLWSMASHHCPDAFPPGQIKRVQSEFKSPFEESQPDMTPTTQPQISRAVIEVADPPIVGRYAHASAWTGQYVLIWGGIHKPSDLDPDLSDGARYDPATDQWTMLPPAPDGMSGPARSVWTGDRWIVRTDHVPDGPVQLASYDPVTNEWTQLDTGPLDYGEGYLMVWTGQEVIFWGGHGGDVLNSSAPVAYNPATATWRELAAAPITARTDPVAAWDGSELLVWGGTASCSGGDSTCVEFATDGAAFDPADGSWRMMPVAPDVPSDTSTAGSVRIDDEFIVFLPVDCESGRCVAGIAYDPDSDSWRSLPALGNMEWSFSAGPVAAGSEIYAWDRTGEGFSYSPGNDRWTDLGGYPMESRFSATVVAVGNQVFVWGGSSGSSTDDPFDDGFLTVP
jgi:N-acetylneuraminic acid mutarotase